MLCTAVFSSLSFMWQRHNELSLEKTIHIIFQDGEKMGKWNLLNKYWMNIFYLIVYNYMGLKIK